MHCKKNIEKYFRTNSIEGLGMYLEPTDTGHLTFCETL